MYSSVSLPSQRADVAATLLSMTTSRRDVVDFTIPVRFSTVVLLFKKTIGDGNVRSVEALLKVPNLYIYLTPNSTSWLYFQNSKNPLDKKIYEIYQVSDVTLWSQWRANEVNCGQYRNSQGPRVPKTGSRDNHLPKAIILFECYH